jgi:chemotaxis protein methyltransferase CheR
MTSPVYTTPVLSEADFDRLSTLIRQESGIRLTGAKKSMLEGRLHKRLKARGLQSFGQYCDLLFSPLGAEERTPMMDLVTTNKTDFFREPAHFALLQAALLPELTARLGERPLRCWSAGCSSGQEPYTLAMVLSEYDLPGGFQMYATDLSTAVLQTAVRAVYPEKEARDVPVPLRQKYLLRSKDQTSPTVRIASTLRGKVQFGTLNFMAPQYDVPADFDLIFCRNVLIYFDRPTQEAVINKLCRHLRPGGYLFLGHSESTTDMQVPLKQIKPTVFRRM